jgi:CDP-diacylglycerol--serine O-phosphatidyltransferase
MSEPAGPKIYLLPNLMTAGNLFCGFAATLKILEGALILAQNPLAQDDASANFYMAIWLILASCILICSMGGSRGLGGVTVISVANLIPSRTSSRSASRRR